MEKLSREENSLLSALAWIRIPAEDVDFTSYGIGSVCDKVCAYFRSIFFMIRILMDSAVVNVMFNFINFHYLFLNFSTGST